MADGTVAERVIRVFADFTKKPTEEITPETTFEGLGLDSLDGMNLIFELEEEFDIMIPDDHVRSMQSVSEAIEGIQHLLDHPEEQQAIAPPPAPKTP